MRKFILLLICPFFVFGIAVNSTRPDAPWYTGPLLTPSSKVVTGGNYNIEPYTYWTSFYGRYDKNSHAVSGPRIFQVTNQVTYKIGLNKKMDISGSFQSYYTETEHVHSSGFNDTLLGLEYQLYLSKPDEWIPNIKLSVAEIFPTGRYQHLKAFKLGTDSGGMGAFLTAAGVTIGKIIHIHDVHFLSLRLNCNTVFKGRARVKGINAYGGDPTTFGKISVGSTCIVQGSFEYTVTRHWVLACDFQAIFSGKDTFHGRSFLPVGGPSNSLYSLAPAIEYNFNAELGIIVGSWFTIAGRNAPRFVTFAGAIDYSF